MWHNAATQSIYVYLPVVATAVIAALVVAAVVVAAVVAFVVASLVAVVTAPGPSVAAVSSGEAPMTRYQVVSVWRFFCYTLILYALWIL